MVKKITKDSGVLSVWEETGVELEPSAKKQLLDMIVNLFITIRGFSFCGAYVELYKQSTKKIFARIKSTTYEAAAT